MTDTYAQAYVEILEIIKRAMEYANYVVYEKSKQEEELEQKITEYFDDFDYIVGDIAYGKLRLKGFNSKTNKNFKEFNDVDKVEDYIKNNCAYGCRWFIISEIKN